MANPRYLLEEGIILYRRKDGERELPDEILGPDGWDPFSGVGSVSLDAFPPPTRGTTPDPSMWNTLEVITLQEAKAIARERRLPLLGW